MSFVNHGTPIVWRRNDSPGAWLIYAAHEGVDGHDQLLLGEQCECGVLGTGVVWAGQTNPDLQIFWEEFTTVNATGCVTIDFPDGRLRADDLPE